MPSGDRSGIRLLNLQAAQQALDIVRLDLRAVRIRQAASQFLQHALRPLGRAFAGIGDAHLRIFIGLATARRPPERIVFLIASLASAAGLIAGLTLLALLALTFLHLLGKALCALLKLSQRPPLRIGRALAVAAAKRTLCLAHGAAGAVHALLGLTAGLGLAFALTLSLLPQLLAQLVEQFA